MVILGCHVVPPSKEIRESQKTTSVSPEDNQKDINVIYTFVAQIHDVYIANLHENSMPQIYVYQFNEFLKRSNNAWIVVGLDANWAIEMTILEIQGTDNIFKKGEDLVFVIHSPIGSFATPQEELQNKIVKLDLQATILKDNLIEFSFLGLHEEY